jgi:SMI1/KNR4 family protein SUKH-1
MNEVFGNVVAVGAMFILAAFVLWLRDRAVHRPTSPEEQAKRQRDYERRLRNPEWSLISSKFGGQVPAAVEAVYRNHRLLSTTNLPENDFEISSFVPADANAFDSEQWFDVPRDAFVFAISDFGDPIYVRTSETASGLPVYVLFHDGGETERVASSLQDVVDRLSGSAESKG